MAAIDYITAVPSLPRYAVTTRVYVVKPQEGGIQPGGDTSFGDTRGLRDEQPFLEYFRVTSSGVDRGDRAYLWIESARFQGKTARFEPRPFSLALTLSAHPAL